MATALETTASIKTSEGASQVDIKLSDIVILRLFEKAYDGYCPVCCNNEVNKGEEVCCECLARIIWYHRNTCGCIE